MIVLGVDLSLTSTGIAGRDWALTLKPVALPKDPTLADKWTRLRSIRRQLIEYVDSADLVVLEAPAYSRNDPGTRELAHLWWWLVGRCVNHDRPITTVSPPTLKVYATGNGRASKDEVVAAIARRHPHIDFHGNDEADALVLAHMGLDHLGIAQADLPKTHRRALDSVQWPPMPERTAA